MEIHSSRLCPVGFAKIGMPSIIEGIATNDQPDRTTMSGLFTVAIVRVVCARAAALAPKKATTATEHSVFDLTVASLVRRLHA